MVAARTLGLALAALLAVAAASPTSQNLRVRRQLQDDNTLQPIEDAEGDEQTRDKRKFEGVTQAKFGIKNAVLGFVFGDGITSRRQVRSTSPERVSLLQTLVPPITDTEHSRATLDSPTTLGDTNRRSTQNSRATLDSPTTLGDTNTKNSPAESSRTWRRESIDTNSGQEVTSDMSRLNTKSINLERGMRQADDIPVFDRNKVSLDFPGALFGPSLSLLIKTTKIVGDVIQNSAVRYQSFLRLFRPLFRGQFEIKGLDPPTTTTTTTTTKAPVAADNEVRRR